MGWDHKNDLLFFIGESLHIHANKVYGEERWLIEEGFRKGNQWCLQHKKFEDFFIKRRHNESESHAYVSGAIHEFIADELELKAELLATRDADVVFFVNGKKWGIEVETGSVYKKSQVKLWKKVELMNSRYGDNWFFVVTNKNLLAKYRRFGKTIARKDVFPSILKILNGKIGGQNLHP